jgi:xanthine dehydrogenase accessory factor
MNRDEAGIVLSSDAHHLALDVDGNTVGESGHFSQVLIDRALDHLRSEQSSVEWRDATSGTVFVRAFRRRPRLLVVGAVDVTVHLVPFARELGFAISVIDPREAFAAAERFAFQPDELIRAWPKEFIAAMQPRPRDAALVLTHDPKIDDPALVALLETNIGYIGALGSRRSHAARLERLQVAGAGTVSLARIAGPAGLHLGTPDASGIALGIAAGIAQWQAARESAETEGVS